HREREPEDDLGRCRVQARGDLGDPAALQHLEVGGEQREALVDDLALAAERADVAVPAQAREAAILYERRSLGPGRDHLMQVAQGDIADAEEPRAPAVTLLDHRGPRLGVVLGPAIAGRRAMQ